MRKEIAGSGTLGDIGAHILDLGQYLLGSNITTLTGTTQTFIKQRPLQAAATGAEGLTANATEEMGEVTVDDATAFLGYFRQRRDGRF